jgi:hypothetical protein
VDEDDERLGIARLQAGLLRQLPPSGPGRILSHADLAAGKLPAPPLVRVRRAPGDQKSPAADRYRHGNVHDRRSFAGHRE